MIFVDTHAHLDDKRFDSDREAVVSRALGAGVTSIITVGTDRASSGQAVALAARFPSVYAAVGVHPHEALHVTDGYLDDLSGWSAQPKVVAIGEIGLDFHYNFAPPDVQRRVFVHQLELARRLGKPVIVHDREAHSETMLLLKEHGRGIHGVLHCYSGGLDMANETASMGFYISFAGPVTFHNAHRLQSVARELPLDRILLETDCPYLSPHPKRGKRNEPANTVLVAQKVAELKGMDTLQVAQITTANAQALFGLPAASD